MNEGTLFLKSVLKWHLKEMKSITHSLAVGGLSQEKVENLVKQYTAHNMSAEICLEKIDE